MTIEHGTSAPTGITISGVYIDEVETTRRDVNVKVMDNDGVFGAGKSIRQEGEINVRGSLLDGASLPETGSGEYTEASPLIEETKEVNKNEDCGDFSLRASFSAGGNGDF